MAALLTKISNESDYARYGFVFEMPLKDFVSKTSLNELPFELAEFAKSFWSHLDFTIYNKITKEILIGIEVDGYSYHKTGTVQSDRDKKKNAIFELIGIPLLRFSTKGFGKEQKIKKCLMD